MKAVLYLFIASSIFFISCSHKIQTTNESHLAVIRIVDRHDMTETINAPDRLASYEKIDFRSPQPYKEVMRSFKRDALGRQTGILTSYHINGQIKQQLETVSSRAHGSYCQWHPNGQLHIEAQVIEGIAQLNENAQSTWIFDEVSRVFDQQGKLEAEFIYDKGILEGDSKYFYPNGVISKILPYVNNCLEGDAKLYDNKGNLIGSSHYLLDLKHGKTFHTGSFETPPFEEYYENGKLLIGEYFDREHHLISSIDNGNGFMPIYENGVLSRLIEYQKGSQNGLVKNFNDQGDIESIYSVKNLQKHGQEWIYWSHANQSPKLLISWYNDEIHGIVKTWYEDGSLESQKEMAHNMRQGLSNAWYRNGDLMLMEEYENDKLVYGKYYKKGQPQVISSVENGSGTATLYDENGVFLRRIYYRKGETVEK
ncbi:MAG: hypothetical protein K9M07_02735 [Simkaniaceae bacterium]|nr:hypothetical protein [Simkaniaceae bacterium]